MITKKGLELSLSLSRLGAKISDADVKTCSRICRLATTYCGVQKELCSGPRWTWNVNTSWVWSEEWQQGLEKRDAQLEEAIRKHCANLPEINGQPVGVSFDGDPRGSTVCLLIRAQIYKRSTRNWDFEAREIAVPGS